MSLIKGKQLAADTLTSREITTAVPGATVEAGDTASEGVATTLALSDHQHAVSTASPSASIDAGDAAAEGSATSLARSDHQHAVSTGAPSQGVGGGNSEGSSTNLARADHDHAIRETGGPTDLTVASIADNQLLERNGTTIAGVTAIDQTQHGDQPIGDGLFHAVATGALAGFMSAADKSKLDALADAAQVDAKESVRAATTVAGTLATDFQNGDSIDGVTLATGDRILIKNQASGVENGIYIVAASGSPTRSTDMPASSNARGNTVWAEEGTVNADTGWLCTNDQGSDVVGTDALVFAKYASGAGSSDTEIQEVVSTENITGTDTALSDTLDQTPKSAGAVMLFLNHVFQEQGPGRDYTISGQTVTWLASSGTAVDMETSDSLIAAYVA